MPELHIWAKFWSFQVGIITKCERAVVFFVVQGTPKSQNCLILIQQWISRSLLSWEYQWFQQFFFSFSKNFGWIFVLVMTSSVELKVDTWMILIWKIMFSGNCENQCLVVDVNYASKYYIQSYWWPSCSYMSRLCVWG